MRTLRANIPARWSRPSKAALILAFVALVPTGGLAAPVVPSVTNLALPAHRETVVALAAGRLAFSVSEAPNGYRDLNGDGNADDSVVHIWDPAMAATTNLRLTVSSPDSYRALVPLDDGGVAFGVSEVLQGADLNRDGDRLDTVVHVWNSATGAANTGLAVTTIRVCCYSDRYDLAALDGGGVAFSVSEAGQGNIDRNSDGDAKDGVVHVWRAVGKTPLNTGLAAKSLARLAGGGLAVLVGELAQHRLDLNGDGDTTDKVLHVWRPGSSPAAVNLSLAAVGFIPLENGGLGLFVDEAAQGAADRNGDGDANDVVVHLWDPTALAVDNLTLALHRTTTSSVVAFGAGRLAFGVSEVQQGSRDLNDDGDSADKVVHVWDPSTRSVTNLRRSGNDLLALKGGRFAYNSGSRLLVWDPANGTSASVGFRANGPARATAGGGVAWGIAEFGPANRDLNGDGDATDYSVLHVWDPTTRATTNLGLVGQGMPLAGGGFAISVSEPSEAFDAAGNGNADDGGDLTGDGDGADDALHVWAPPTGTTNFRTAGNPVAALSDNDFAVLVNERQQRNTDLNGDGDALDSVIHIADHHPVPLATGLIRM